MKNLTILLAVILISTSSYGKGKKHIYTDTTFNHIEFSEITFTVVKKTNDTLEIEGILKQKTIIDGIPCYGNISFTKDWKPKYFTLADAHTFGENTFPKDTYIGIKIDRSSLKAKSYFVVSNAGETVNTCRFTSNQLINGLSCDGEGVIFTTDWNLRICILGEDDTIAGNLLKKGTLTVFGKSGSFSIYCLYDPIIQGYHCSGTGYASGIWMGGGGIRFYPSGQLKYCQPVDDIVEVQGVYCKPSSTRGGIWFYESGKLKRCTSAKDQTIDGVLHKKKYTLKFDEEGNITESYKDKFF